MSRCALGLSVHTGWAACVAASGSLRAPGIEAREEIEMLGDRDRFLFHRAAEMDLAAARRSVARAGSEAMERATAAIARLVGHVHAAGHALVGCAIVAQKAALPASLEEIIAAHPRIHAAEGCFYRDVLRGAAEANGLTASVIPPRSLDFSAHSALLAEAGRGAGKPWAKDQKLAALAAWSLL
jgi:hypothetical protein